MYLATSETKARAKTVSTHPTSSFLQQKFPGLMKRELSVRCALKAWSTEKGKREKSLPPPSSPSLSLSFLSIFSPSWSSRIRISGPDGVRPVYFSPGQVRFQPGDQALSWLFLCTGFCLFGSSPGPLERENNSRRGYKCQIKVINGGASSFETNNTTDE